MMKRYLLVCYLFFGIAECGMLLAQPGVCDPGFNVSDDCTYGSGESFDAPVHATVLQPDGKLIAGGDFTVYNGVGRNRIARLHHDGTLDQNFNPGAGFSGIFTSYNPTTVNALALQADGKIIAGGNFLTYNGNSSRGIVRLNADGTTDKSFNVGTGLNAPAYTIVLQPDGKILVGGNFTLYNGVSLSRVMRLNTDGSVDTSFKPGTGFNNYVRRIAVLSNGKILAGGFFSSYNGNTAGRIARLKSDGSFDASFSTGSGFQNEVNTLLPLSNGKVLAFGHFLSYRGTLMQRIVRIDSNGNIDNTFTPGTGFDAAVYAAALQSDGKIVVAGAFTKFNNKTYNRICRLHANGTIDTGFKTDITYVAGEIIYSTLVQPDGKIISAGNITHINLMNGLAYIGRLNADGSYDTGYNHGTGFQVSEVADFAIQSDQKIIAAGTFYSYNGTVMPGTARLNANGELDTTFRSSIKTSSAVHSVSLQPDGKILVGGGFLLKDAAVPKNIARLNSDGSVDTGFRVGTGTNSPVYTTALQSDGKVLLGGNFTLFNGNAINRIVRLNTDGTIDTGFKSGSGFNDIVYKIIVQPDGKLLVCGRFTQYNNIAGSCIVRLESDGKMDTTFKTGTGFGNPFPSTGIVLAYSMTLQNDGKILAVGNFTKYNGSTGNGIVRILSDGRIDSGFQTGTGFDTYPYRLIVQSDGKIIVSGRFTTFRNISGKGIVRIWPDGKTDTSFNPGTAFDRYTRALAFHDGEKILVGGDFTSYSGTCRTRIARLFNCETLSREIRSNCGPYSWRDGKTYSASTNKPFIEFPNSNHNGCDSFVLLNLTVNNPGFSDQSVTACGSYKWINGVTYTSSNDTATYTYTGGAYNGCDSTVKLNLTINQPDTGYDPVIACKKYKWIDGITYASSNNTASFTFPGGAYNGCDSIVILNLGIIKVTTTVSKNLTVLTSNEFNAVYQWLDCDKGYRPIAGATNRTFEPDSSGHYAVSVTKDGCTDTSACIEVVVENSAIWTTEKCSVRIYPSPANGKLYIDPGVNCSLKKVNIVDQLGRVQRMLDTESHGLLSIDMEGLSGIFFVELVEYTGAVTRYKIIAE